MVEVLKAFQFVILKFLRNYNERGVESAYCAGIDRVVIYNELTVAHDFTHASCKIIKFKELAILL